MRRGACLLEDSLLRRMVIGNSEGDELVYVQPVLSVRLQQERSAFRKLQQLENVAFRTPATRCDIGGAVAGVDESLECLEFIGGMHVFPQGVRDKAQFFSVDRALIDLAGDRVVAA